MTDNSQQAFQTFATARRELNEVVTIYRMIDDKLQSTLKKIQEVHQTEGENQAKSVGKVELKVQEIRGVPNCNENTCVKVGIESDEDETASALTFSWDPTKEFPLNHTFEPVLSREASIQFVLYAENEDSESLGEFEIPVSSLLDKEIDAWYPLTKESNEIVTEPPKIEEIKEETMKEDQKEDASQVETVQVEATQVEEAGKTINNDSEKTEEETTNDETKQESSVKVDEPKAESNEDKNKEAESKEESTESAEAAESTEQEEINGEIKEDTDVATANEDSVVKSITSPEVHVSMKITLSEVERLAQTVLTLSKQKSDLELAKQVAEQKLLQARSQYERIQAATKSQSITATSMKPRSIASAGGIAKRPVQPKDETAYQRIKTSLKKTFTPQRVQLLKNVAIFGGSVLLFHYGGENFAV